MTGKDEAVDAIVRLGARPSLDEVLSVAAGDKTALELIRTYAVSIVVARSRDEVTRAVMRAAARRLAEHPGRPERPRRPGTKRPSTTVPLVDEQGWRDGRVDPQKLPTEPRCEAMLDGLRCGYRVHGGAQHGHTWWDDDDMSPRAVRWREARAAAERGEQVYP